MRTIASYPNTFNPSIELRVHKLPKRSLKQKLKHLKTHWEFPAPMFGYKEAFFGTRVGLDVWYARGFGYVFCFIVRGVK